MLYSNRTLVTYPKIFLAFCLGFAVPSCGLLFAQQKGAVPVTRCFTMQRVALLNNNVLTRKSSGVKNPAGSPGPVSFAHYRLTATVTVPVVVHIVLPNPYQVTDADVQAQIDRLNLDFSGLNGDSSNIPSAFQSLRGHSNIQFCLAKRTPAGLPTSGIERRVSQTKANASSVADPVKSAADGGLDVWNPVSYLNIWVGDDDGGGDILGYSQFPNSTTSPSSQDGVFINYKAWGGSSCYTLPDYDKGRSVVHEIGHYFGLLHVWGDDDGCDGDDFRNLDDVQSSCLLPAGLFNPAGQGNTASDIGDTPNQGGETNSCNSGTVTDGCATGTNGKMYQNFMDYTLDACMSLFTNMQVERMEWVLENCRAGLISSLGCQPPLSSVLRDAQPLQSVNPGGFELNGCATRTYASAIFCADSFTPKVRITNNTATPLTSVVVGYRLDDGAVVSQTVSVNIPLAGSAVVTFPTISVTSGNHQIKYFTSNPNGAPDQVTANDTLTADFTVNGTATTPFREDFSSLVFPPASWSVINPDGGLTWQRHTEGNGTPGSAYVNTFNYESEKERDDLVTPRISYSTAGIDSVKLIFDVAAATYSDPDEPSVELDTLEILVSKDCGSSFTTVYKKWGKELISVPTPENDEFFPSSSQWRRDTADLSAFAGQSPIQIFFRITNNYENNIFLDNVNVITSQAPDLLKKQGYLFLPNPFGENFTVWFYHQPTDLQSITLYNAAGQMVWKKSFTSADNFIRIDLFGKPAGVYFVQMRYADASKNFTEQVVKTR